VIAYAVEAYVFGYLGITFFSFIHLDWSWQLFVGMLFICIVGRFVGTIGIIKIFEIFGYKSGINMRDLIFISYAGIIRGAVAFGLVLRIDESVEHRSVIVTTSLALVCFTTIFLGSTVVTMQRFLFKEKEGEKHHHVIDPDNSQDRVEFLPYVDDPADSSGNQKGFFKGLDKFVKPFILYKYNEADFKQQMENVVHGTTRKS
jgi:NhaP-type Na+/H+ or K+/H+ antiporter